MELQKEDDDMKRYSIALVAVSTALGYLTGCCCKRATQPATPAFSETSVDDDLGLNSAYAVAGGVLEWHSEAPNYPQFTIHFLKTNPCLKDDNLTGSVVLCHVSKPGIYKYEIRPYPDPDPNKKLTQTPPSYAKVPPCTSCTHTPLEVSAREGTPSAGTNSPNNATSTAKNSQRTLPNVSKLIVDYLIDTDIVGSSPSCTPVADDPQHASPASVSVGKTLEWRIVDVDDGAALTITFPDSPSPNRGTPCSNGAGSAASPLHAGDVCTIDKSASGDYYYQLNRSDCTNTSAPIKITVQ